MSQLAGGRTRRAVDGGVGEQSVAVGPPCRHEDDDDDDVRASSLQPHHHSVASGNSVQPRDDHSEHNTTAAAASVDDVLDQCDDHSEHNTTAAAASVDDVLDQCDDHSEHSTAAAAASVDDVLDQCDDRRRRTTPGFVYALAFFSALGGFLFGYDTGVVSGAMLLLKGQMNLSLLWQELLVSSTVGAAAVAALAGGPLNGLLGRRRCILAASLTFTVGGLVLALAPDRWFLLLGRITVGLGIGIASMTERCVFSVPPPGIASMTVRGIASMTVPVYMAEMSPPHLRGQLVTINTLFITGGQFCASLIDGAFSYLEPDGWRYMLGLSVVPAALQFTGFLFLPESPRWLLQKGRNEEARRVLDRIRGGGGGVDEEYDAIRTSIEEDEKEAGAGGLIIWRMLRHAPTRRALTVGCGLQMFQQLSGINTVMYYSATILQMAGVRDNQRAIWMAAATAATNFLFTLVGVWLVERVGRRKLTVASILGTGLSLMVLASGFLLSAQNSPPVTLNPVGPPVNSTCSLYGSCSSCILDPDCGFCYRENGTDVFDCSCTPVSGETTEHAAWGRCSNQTAASEGPLWAYNYCPTSYSWLVLLGLILYLACFAPGMGPMPWTVNSEIYPLWARSTGNACSAGVNWTFNVLVSLTFLHVAEYLTYYGAFFLYAGLAGLGLLFVLGCLPETQGLRLEDMENLFTGQLCSCGASCGDVPYIRRCPGFSRVHYGATGSDRGVAYITLQ